MTGYMVGPAARAIELTRERSRRLSGADWRPEWDASIALFFVNGPFHPWWSWWVVTTVHLRDIAGTPPPARHYPTAEYEFAIWSLDTHTRAAPFDPAQNDDDAMHWTRHILQPPDVVKHFDVGTTLPIAERDAIARRITTKAVDAIINGAASPDSDYRSWWRAAIDATVTHELTGGAHIEGRPS